MTKKRPTKRKEASKGSVLVQLNNNRLLATKVNEALDSNKTYDEIIELCLEYEFTISKASLSRYKEKREESIRTGTPLEDLLDGRVKSKVISIADKEVRNSSMSNMPNEMQNQSPQDTIYSDVEFLDDIILKGFRGTQHVTIVDPQLAMKAIEIKHKITGGALQGMSVAGLRELNLRNVALETAITSVMFKYIPEELHEEVADYIEEVENEFYENLDLTEEDKRLNKALKDATKLG